MQQLYILLLGGGHYYVGKTVDLERRLDEHRRGECTWTRMHGVVQLVETRLMRTGFDEDAVTKEYMAKHGVDKVRGGAYVKTELDADTVRLLQIELRSAADLCTRCGRPSHFVAKCFARRSADGTALTASPNRGGDGAAAVRPMPREVRRAANQRARCGHASHVVADCYARTSAEAYARSGQKRQQTRGLPGGAAPHLAALGTLWLAPPGGAAPHVASSAAPSALAAARASSSTRAASACFRCGRPGHYATTCNAFKSAAREPRSRRYEGDEEDEEDEEDEQDEEDEEDEENEQDEEDEEDDEPEDDYDFGRHKKQRRFY